MEFSNEQPNALNINGELNAAGASTDELTILDDLLLEAETEDQIKGGPGSGWCSQCAVIYSNHNETVAGDNDVELEEESLLLDDLLLETQAEDQVKGGPGSGWCTQCGGIYSNHNETAAEDDEAEVENLDDLPVEEDEQVKGGGWGYGDSSVKLNHNETEAEDDEAEVENLDDLPVEEEEQVKGGTGGGVGGITFNHNETEAEDDEAEAENLDDLPVEEDEQVKGGGWGYGESTVKLNHNETAVEDDDPKGEPLSDLTVTDDNQIQGGSTVYVGSANGGVWKAR